MSSASKKNAKSVVESSLNLDEIREIAKLVEKYGFADFEFENEKIRIRISKSNPTTFIPAIHPFATTPVSPVVSIDAKTQTEQKVEAEKERQEVETSSEDRLHKITSPIVGTFYRAPAPDKPPYVKIGDRVEPETVVCIVEAMKLMNEIQAGVSGEVVKIYVENGQPVEYGQPLFGIKLS